MECKYTTYLRSPLAAFFLTMNKTRFGGSGTTANTFLFLVWAVCRHETVKAKLQQELREAFPNPAAVPDYTVSTLNHCITGSSFTLLTLVLNPGRRAASSRIFRQ